MKVKIKKQGGLSGGRRAFYFFAIIFTALMLSLLMIFNQSFSAGSKDNVLDLIQQNPLQSLAVFGCVACILLLYVLDTRATGPNPDKRRNFIIPALGLIVVFVAQILLFDKRDIAFSPVLLCVLLTAVLVGTRAGLFINAVCAALSVLSLALVRTLPPSTCKACWCTLLRVPL